MEVDGEDVQAIPDIQSNQNSQGNQAISDIQGNQNSQGNQHAPSNQDVEITLSEAVEQMKRFWVNERISRELLPHQFNFIDLLSSEIKGASDQLETVTDRGNIAYGSRLMDLERIQYIINSYIRARLQKIELNAAAILMEHTERQRTGKDDLLDEREFTFAENFHNNRLEVFNNAFLNRLPDQLKNLPVPRSSRNNRCLIRILHDNGLENVSVFDMEEPNSENLVDLEKNCTYLIPFNSIQEHLEGGSLELL